MRAREIVYLILGLLIGIAITAGRADEVRLEAAVGQCKHVLAGDTTWHYGLGGYENNWRLNPACGNLGLLWNMDHTFGVRVSYVDLGSVDAEATYPIDENAYKVASANHTSIVSPTGYFQGSARSRGFSFGPVFQAEALKAHWQAEFGAAALYSTWHAMTHDTQNWAYADAWKLAPYIGAGVRYAVFTFNVRRYARTQAEQATVNPLFIGPTRGQVTQVLLGVSIPL